MTPNQNSQLAYIRRSTNLLTERLYSVPMSAASRIVTKRAIERLHNEALRIHWGLPRRPHYTQHVAA